jgi:hypothetical protein
MTQQSVGILEPAIDWFFLLIWKALPYRSPFAQYRFRKQIFAQPLPIEHLALQK